MIRLLFAAALFISLSQPALAVDDVTAFTGMVDSKYYKYEVRGQSALSVTLTQSLWEGGATAARMAIQKARLASASHQLADATISLVFDAITAHVNVFVQQQLVELARDNVADYSETISLLKSRVDSGLSTPADVSLVESRLFRAQAVLTEYQAALVSAKASFEMLTGRPVPGHLDEVKLPKIPYKGPDGAIGACLERNPRLLAQHAQVREAQGQESLAFSGNFPNIGIEAGPRWQVQNTPQDSLNHGIDAFLTFQWNLYEGGATQSAYKQAAAQKRGAMHNTQSVADSLRSDILGTWAQYKAAGERIGLYSASMDTASRARQVFQEQYLLGAKNLLDLLDADNEYFLAATSCAVARGDQVIGAYRLLALGGDLLAAMNVALPAK